MRILSDSNRRIKERNFIRLGNGYKVKGSNPNVKNSEYRNGETTMFLTIF